MTAVVLPLRSLLFVPATRLDRIEKAINTGADAVVVDWEDAVADADKVQARAATLAYLATQPAIKVWVRMNAAHSAYHADDVLACQHCEGIVGVLLPKAERMDDVEAVAKTTNKPIIALIESPRGLINLPQIAQAQGLSRLSFGALDLAHALGVTPDTPGGDFIMHQIRYQLLLHTQVNDLAAPIDTVYPDFNDEVGLNHRVELWQQMGFAGMLCIHPRQIAPVHAHLQPDPALLAWASAVVIAAVERGQVAFQLDGEMIDAPVIARARRLLAQANQ